MLAGYPPFFDDNPFGIYEKILAGKIDWPRHMDPIAKDLVKKLLVQDRTKRLGNMKVPYSILPPLLPFCYYWERGEGLWFWLVLLPIDSSTRWGFTIEKNVIELIEQNGADDVKRHRWFKGLDWEDIFYRKLKVDINTFNSTTFVTTPTYPLPPSSCYQ